MGGKQYLMTPGPTPVPPQVLAALAEPVVHHRGSDFRPVYERCLQRLAAVDPVSSLGAIPLETDAWGLDAVVSGSQKALMTPPGLAFVALSERAERAAVPQSFYFDWIKTRKAQDRRDSAFTPAVSLVRALEVALGLLLDAGLDEAFDRHRRLGRACREGVKALGLELFSPDDDSSAVVPAVRMPNGFDSGDVVRSLRDRFGITIANGQGELKGRIFRIGHIGYHYVLAVTTAPAATEGVLG